MTNAVLDTIAARRSHRAYQDTPVTQAQLDALLAACLQSPSAVNKQPWHISVVRDKQLLSDINDATREGMMRKDDEAVAQWTPALVEQCAARQREIASDIWQALKPGGIFIYSTCTFNRAENEDMIDFLVRSLGAEPVDIVSDPSWGIHKGVDTPYPCFRFMPHLTRIRSVDTLMYPP